MIKGSAGCGATEPGACSKGQLVQACLSFEHRISRRSRPDSRKGDCKRLLVQFNKSRRLKVLSDIFFLRADNYLVCAAEQNPIFEHEYHIS